MSSRAGPGQAEDAAADGVEQRAGQPGRRSQDTGVLAHEVAPTRVSQP